MKNSYVFVLSFLTFFIGYSLFSMFQKTPEKKEIIQKIESEEVEINRLLANEIIIDILQSIPSPLETSLLIKEIGTKYNSEILTRPEMALKANSEFAKALNIGMLATDVGYANLHGEITDAEKYYQTIQYLSDDLNLPVFEQKPYISQVLKNENNLDFLLQFTQQNFEKLNTELADKNREKLSILMLTGGWIEAMNIACEMYSKTKNDQLKEKIGVQKVAWEQILLVLEMYKNDNAEIQKLYDSLKEISMQTFQLVKITVAKGEPLICCPDYDSEIVIEEGSSSVILMDEKLIPELQQMLREIKEDIVYK